VIGFRLIEVEHNAENVAGVIEEFGMTVSVFGPVGVLNRRVSAACP
jgi:hypothetical protein